MATITLGQKQRLGGRSLKVALADSRRFEEDSKLLFSQETAKAYPEKWVAVYNGEVATASEDFESLLSILNTKGISPALSAIAFIGDHRR
jgi:hypothetical protein